ncbi:hypothetical protein N824_10795 [Pedobacter sp. V48]|nr:hypothetical protein N824_10795 [Pedobacter sp. V48]
MVEFIASLFGTGKSRLQPGIKAAVTSRAMTLQNRNVVNFFFIILILGLISLVNFCIYM